MENLTPRALSQYGSKKILTLVAAVHGDLAEGEAFLEKTLTTFGKIQGSPLGWAVDFVFVFDGSIWPTSPIVQSISHSLPGARTLFHSLPCHLPAQLFNEALALTQSEYVLFSRPSFAIDEGALSRLLGELSESEIKKDIRVMLDERNLARFQLPPTMDGDVIHAWLLSADFLSPHHVLIPTTLVKNAGGFDTSPLLQRSSEWAMFVRLTATASVRIVGIFDFDEQLHSTLDQLYSKVYPASADMRQRYVAKQAWLSRQGLANDKSQEKILRDLPNDHRQYHDRQIRRFNGQSNTSFDSNSATVPLKILVIGGLWDYHHNRLCFFNYFDHFAGQGIVSYKSIFDHLLTKQDIFESDLVIMTRTKTNNVTDILRWCDELNVPTLYMIDDNWFSVATDWPEQYGEIFGPKSNYFRNFIAGISGADYVLTYNRHLAEDLAPHARRILTLKNSVELDLFESTPRPEIDRFVVGYSGSPRYMIAPFVALGEVGRTHPDVDILVSGTVLPEQEKQLEGCSIIRSPHMSYSRYAAEIRKSGVDVLLAPLDDSRTSASKCPNKYLEITALGAVGIYSNVDPYPWYIDSGKNGLLVQDSANVHQWRDAIIGLLDKKRLRSIHAAARDDVSRNYTVPTVAQDFLKMIMSVITEGKAKC